MRRDEVRDEIADVETQGRRGANEWKDHSVREPWERPVQVWGVGFEGKSRGSRKTAWAGSDCEVQESESRTEARDAGTEMQEWIRRAREMRRRIGRLLDRTRALEERAA